MNTHATRVEGRLRLFVFGKTIRRALCVLGGLWVLAVISPASPLAFVRANLLLGMGQTDWALGIYDDVAEQGVTASLRSAALHRSAMLWSIQQRNPDEALRRWEMLAQTSSNLGVRADAWKRVGDLLSEVDGRHRDAAKAYERSADFAIRSEYRSTMMLLASEQWLAAEEFHAAEVLLHQVLEQAPGHRTGAFFGLANTTMKQR